MLGLWDILFSTVINPDKKGFLFPVKPCIAGPVILSTLTTVTKIDQGYLWPSQPSTLTSALTSSHPLPLRCCVLALIRSFFNHHLCDFQDNFLFFLYLFPGQPWLSCAELEWRVRSKTVNGAGSLWGNKRQHHRPWFLLSLINLGFVFSSLKFVLFEV